MLHAYSLVHDDLPAMDDDDLRRGKPSTHRAFDEATAILAGDALQTRAFEVLAEPDTHSDPQARCELVAALAAASGARGMAGGQMIDMLAEGEALTAAGSHAAAGAEDRAADPVQRRGRRDPGPRGPPAQRPRSPPIGRDLGAPSRSPTICWTPRARTEETGKTAGKDAAAGKATLVALLGVERAAAQAGMLRGAGGRASRRLRRGGRPAACARGLGRGAAELIAHGSQHDLPRQVRRPAESPGRTPLLDRVRVPADLRNFSAEQLQQLADELRAETIDAVSRHRRPSRRLRSGVVELTVALHAVFDTPRDRLIWDVGHQAYPHKILTGRRDRIRTLRQGGGLSGFTRRAESEYDPFGAAHSSRPRSPPVSAWRWRAT